MPSNSSASSKQDVMAGSTHRRCRSRLIQHISAPVETVWSILRRFDKPQKYKRFIKSCTLLTPHASIGAIREVEVISGLPAVNSRERLEVLDEERHVISFRIIGGEHRLVNYSSSTSVNDDGSGGSVVVESYVVDVPDGNTPEDTRVFVDTIVSCNLLSLKETAEMIECC